MDNSTENVTLSAGVINDVLKNYQDKRQEYKELFDIANGYDYTSPTAKMIDNMNARVNLIMLTFSAVSVVRQFPGFCISRWYHRSQL